MSEIRPTNTHQRSTRRLSTAYKWFLALFLTIFIGGSIYVGYLLVWAMQETQERQDRVHDTVLYGD